MSQYDGTGCACGALPELGGCCSHRVGNTTARSPPPHRRGRLKWSSFPMSAPVTLSQVAALAAQLPPPERKQLAETILQDLAAVPQPPTPTLRWRDLAGAVA